MDMLTMLYFKMINIECCCSEKCNNHALKLCFPIVAGLMDMMNNVQLGMVRNNHKVCHAKYF